MESIIRDVPALDQAHRRSLEALLGHELENNQRVYIAVLPDSAAPTPEQRQQAWERLRLVTAEIEQQARQKGISPEQWALLVDEECETVRYGKKS
jgi:hypothetical protein